MQLPSLSRSVCQICKTFVYEYVQLVFTGTVLDRGQDTAPSTAATRFDKLLTECEEFFEGEEEFGPPLYAGLASLIDKALRRKPSDDKIKKLMGTYKNPENVPNLGVPSTNKDVQQAFSKGAAYIDTDIRKAQTALAKGLIPMLTWMHDFKSSEYLSITCVLINTDAIC